MSRFHIMTWLLKISKPVPPIKQGSVPMAFHESYGSKKATKQSEATYRTERPPVLNVKSMAKGLDSCENLTARAIAMMLGIRFRPLGGWISIPNSFRGAVWLSLVSTMLWCSVHCVMESRVAVRSPLGPNGINPSVADIVLLMLREISCGTE
jgi:hypothetical protein